jgi:hypothetical protein
MRKSNKPAWWQLDGIVAGATILLWWEARTRLAGPLHQIVLVAIIVLVYSLIAWWVQANQARIEREHLERQVRARTRQIVAELKRKERAEVQEHQARASQSRSAGRGLTPTPVQAHFRQVMLAGKQQKT